MRYIFLCFFIQTVVCLSESQSTLNNATIISLDYNVPFNSSVDSSFEYILKFSNINVTQDKGPPRITIKSNNANKTNPLIVVSRQPDEVLSWKLPVTVQTRDNAFTYTYKKTSRTLCNDFHRNRTLLELGNIQNQNPIISIATASKEPINFEIVVDFPEHFYLNSTNNITVSPSEPQYFYYKYSSETQKNGVFLKIKSSNDICTTVSIQHVECPVFDLNEDITFKGFYETFTTKAGLMIPINHTFYNFTTGFFVVFVVQPDDFLCTGTHKQSLGYRKKELELTISPTFSYEEYMVFITYTASGMIFFCITFGVGFFFWSWVETVTPNSSENGELSHSGDTISNSPSLSLDETDFDHMPETETSHTVQLIGNQVYLHHLARKPPEVLIKKSYLYLYNVLTIALFYGMPVIQLVVNNQGVLITTGNLDLCYYNFLCSHPLGFLGDFNHVFSNIGYILFGVLFIIITLTRERSHEYEDPHRIYGIPQHYGLFYAMGVSLIMEGVLSASYHVCPSETNFQFDTSFMYVMAVLCIVKLYQNRHPDINANAYSTFGVLAIAIFLCIIGMFEQTQWFWICFVILHILTCFYLSLKVYYMGCWKLNVSALRRLHQIAIYEFWAGPLNTLKPCYKARFIMILIGNIFNWSLAGYALVYQPYNFGVFLLLVFMGNTLFYFFFYIAMKYVHREKVNLVTWIFLSISILCAVSAMYFFLRHVVSWARTPAKSRELNVECSFAFYDTHDIWHFLSAIGMFFTFTVLLTLDDDIMHRPHIEIPVF